MFIISKRSNNYVITVDTKQLLELQQRKAGKNINLTDFYKIQTIKKVEIQPPLLFDGKPRESFTKSNPSDPQKILMLETLRQYADIETIKINTSNKYRIKNIYQQPQLAVDGCYTKYLRPLILDTLCNEYQRLYTPNAQTIIYTLTNNEIAYNMNFIGDMFHFKVFSNYDTTKTMIDKFNDTYSDISLIGFTRYLLSKIDEDIKQKIDYAIESLDINWIDKKEIVLDMHNKPLGILNIAGNVIDIGTASENILNELKAVNSFMLEKNFNKEFAESLKNFYEHYNEIPPPYQNYKISWEFSVDNCFLIQNELENTMTDFDYYRKKLNLNVIHKFIEVNGLKAFEEYQAKIENKEIPQYGHNVDELKKYYKNVSYQRISHYINDMQYIIEQIAI